MDLVFLVEVLLFFFFLEDSDGMESVGVGRSVGVGSVDVGVGAGFGVGIGVIIGLDVAEVVDASEGLVVAKEAVPQSSLFAVVTDSAGA